jgi:hypothetical protein
MKKVVSFIGKILLVIFILISLGINVGLAVAYIRKSNDLNAVNQTYRDAQANLNSENQESQITIDNLEKSFSDLNDEVERLRRENEMLENDAEEQTKKGFGEIRGEVLPFIVGDSSFSQYQLVCAENITNKNLQYCVTVSALDRNYAIVLPEGKYEVNSRIVTQDPKLVLANYKAYYTEYIKCVREKGQSECDRSQLSKAIQIEVKANQIVNNINPIDWTETKSS